MRGWWAEFQPERDTDEELSDFEEKMRKFEEKERVEKEAKKQQAGGLKKASKDPLTAKNGPQTLKARSAASALSGTTKERAVPSFAAPTATSKSRMPSNIASKKSSAMSQTISGNPRHGAARAASNSTLGYSKGRAVSASNRKPGENPHSKKIAEDAEVRSVEPMRTTLDDLFDTTAALDLDEDGGVRLGSGLIDLDEDEELRNFQLEVVEI